MKFNRYVCNDYTLKGADRIKMRKQMFQTIMMICVVICACGLSGCNKKEMSDNKQIDDINIEWGEMEKYAETSDGYKETTDDKWTDQAANTEAQINGNAEEQVEVNTQAQTVELSGQDFYPAKAFGCNAEKLLMCQWNREGREAALFEMEVGTDLLQKQQIDIPEDWNIHGIVSDREGHSYILLRSPWKEEGMLSVIREYDGNSLINEMDISDALGSKMGICEGFLRDGNGNFYIKGMEGGMYLSAEGKFLWESRNDLQEIRDSYAAAIGKDGNVYITYVKEDTSYIGRVSTENGSIEKEYALEGIGTDDRILALAQGTDSDFLLYSVASGIWTFDLESGCTEKRVDRSESSLPYNEYIIIRAFLRDGRFLLVKNVSENDRLTGQIWEYIPAGR
jgi:hypothetical protein